MVHRIAIWEVIYGHMWGCRVAANNREVAIELANEYMKECNKGMKIPEPKSCENVDFIPIKG